MCCPLCTGLPVTFELGGEKVMAFRAPLEIADKKNSLQLSLIQMGERVATDAENIKCRAAHAANAKGCPSRVNSLINIDASWY